MTARLGWLAVWTAMGAACLDVPPPPGAEGTDDDAELQACDAPDSPEFGFVQVSNLTVGGTATYSCATGYVIDSNAPRICQADGTWSGPVPTCVAGIPCSEPPVAPYAGYVSTPSLAAGSVATYSCQGDS